jgi:hypothetical protein
MHRMSRILAAASVAGLAVASSATPSSAQRWHSGGGGHVGGWHGGGWHGGGWHGGGWRRGYGGGGWWGPAVGLGVLGGLAAGAIATAPYYGYGAPYNDGCTQYQAVYDVYGNFIGNQAVNVC